MKSQTLNDKDFIRLFILPHFLSTAAALGIRSKGLYVNGGRPYYSLIMYFMIFMSFYGGLISTAYLYKYVMNKYCKSIIVYIVCEIALTAFSFCCLTID